MAQFNVVAVGYTQNGGLGQKVVSLVLLGSQ